MTKSECSKHLANAALAVNRLPDDVNIHISTITDAGPTIQVSSNDGSEIHFDIEFIDPRTAQTVHEMRFLEATIVKYDPKKYEEVEPCETESV